MRKAFALILPFLACAALADSLPYGQQSTFAFIMLDSDGAPLESEVDGGAEVSLNCDDGGAATATNDFTESSDGGYEIVLTAAELECKNLIVDVAAGTKNVYKVETYGHPDAQHPWIGVQGPSHGTAQATDSDATTVQLPSTLSLGDDVLNGATVYVADGTASGERRVICDYVGSSDEATLCSAFETDPTDDSKIYVSTTTQGFIQADSNGVVNANTLQVSGDAAAADSLEAALDGTGGVTLDVTLAAGAIADNTLDGDALDDIDGTIMRSVRTAWGGDKDLECVLAVLLAQTAGTAEDDNGTVDFDVPSSSGGEIADVVSITYSDGDRSSVTITCP